MLPRINSACSSEMIPASSQILNCLLRSIMASSFRPHRACCSSKGKGDTSPTPLGGWRTVVGESGNGTGSGHRPLTSIDMPGLLAFHAHPDDEVTATGGPSPGTPTPESRSLSSPPPMDPRVRCTTTRTPRRSNRGLPRFAEPEIAEAMTILGVKHQEFLGYQRLGDDGRAVQQASRSASGRPTSRKPSAGW